MHDLRQELLRIIDAGQRDGRAQRKLDLLRSLGVAAAGLEACGGMIGLTTIEADAKARLFQPFPTGPEALIVPVAVLGDVVIDLLALPVRQPETWYRRTGHAPILGEEAAERADFMGEPLEVFATPLAWLRGGGSSVVVLDWRASLSLYLGGVDKLLVEDDALGHRLKQALQRDVELPDIRVSGGLANAA